MDINKLLKNVNNVDEYISVTQEISDTSKNTKMQINITTVLALKKIRSLEIEFLNKCYENGAACILFERLLSLPPSKIWGVLGKELVSLLQYWLDAIRKYLINHNVHWWSFLKLILKFIKEICLKDPSIPNILVELTAECLFDIASTDNPDSQQRYEILHCLNVFSAECSREIRFAMRNKFGDYFTKLASHLATSGYLPCQYSTLEALVRWLVPRHDATLRAAAAARWFPSDLCPEAAKEIFLNNSWMNFFQDSRNFLNILNKANGLVTSVVCKRLTIGKILIISGAEKQQAWLDINSSGKSISVILDPRALETIRVLNHRACETLIFAEDDTQTARLHSESEELTLSLDTYRPPRVQPLDAAAGAASDVRIVISSRVDVRRLDAVLRNVFGDKYHLLMDLNTELSVSPPRSRDARRNQNSSEEDTRFSHPVEVRRKKHSGYMVRSKNAGSLISPSTASTSSLAQLHDKLAALPKYRYEKEPVSVCAQPQLSSVTEINEADDRSFHSVTALKFKPYGVCYKNLTSNTGSLPKAIKNKSDTLKLNPRPGRRLSPVVSDENSTSCLLVATVGSADVSVINDTVERFSKSKDNNIVDLLIQEALQAKPITKENLIHNEENSEAIENTPIQADGNKNTSKKSNLARKKKYIVVSKSTTDDESNTETINETPAFSNKRNNKLSRRQSVFKLKEPEPKVADKQSSDVQTVEQFFSEHFSETKAGEMVISPSLAKKINESSSESSDHFDEKYLSKNEDLMADVEQFEFNDIDIVECLNEMVDKICSDFDKCSKNNAALDIFEETLCINVSIRKTAPASKPNKNIKLTYKETEGKKTVTKKRKNNIEQNPKKNMPTIIEQKDEEVLKTKSPKHHNIEDSELSKINSPVITKIENEPSVEKDETTPVIKRKRKLYSPKDDELEKERKGIKLSETDDDDIVLSELKTYNRINTPKTTATCYKDIERERQKNIFLPRSKKCRGKVEDSPSPRTLKMNAVFDKLKTTVESKEKLILADKTTAQSDVYNFTSDSEDGDFKEKKTEIQKRTSTTTRGRFEPATSKRIGRPRTRPNYSEKSTNDDAKKTKTVKRKKPVKKTKSKVNVNIEPVTELKDERMRKTGPEELNSSIVIEKPKAIKPCKAELELHKQPEMEPITEDHDKKVPIKIKPNKKTKKAEILSLKKEKGEKKYELKTVSDKEDDITVSPLPGLLVESIPTTKDDTNEIETSSMLQKFKKICQGTNAINNSTNTQNMSLSDIERCNNSPQNVSLNITDEICFVGYNEENIETKTERKNLENRNIKLSKNNKKIKTEKPNLRKDISSEVIEISEIPDIKSEKSIATVGITAHGDFDEAPPSPEMIRTRMQPREIEDLSESTKNFFLKLDRETNDSTCEDRESSNSKEDAEIVEFIRPIFERSSSVKSPVVSVQKIFFDDISKRLPSRRTSYTSEKSSPKLHENSESVKISNIEKFQTKIYEKKYIADEVIKKHKPKKSCQNKTIVDSPKMKLPIVAISLEEFNNLFPMPKSLEPKDDVETNVDSLQEETKQRNVTLVYNTRQNAKTIKDVKISDEIKVKNLRKLKSKNEFTQNADKIKAKAMEESTTTNTTEQNSDFTSFRLRVPSRNTNKNSSVAKKIKGKIVKNTDDSDSDGNAEPKVKNKRIFEKNNSIISPIEDFVPNVHNNDESDDDQCIKKIRQIFSKKRVKTRVLDKDISLRKSTQVLQSPDSTSTKINLVQSQGSIRKVTQPLDSTSMKLKEKLEQHNSSLKKVEESFKRPMKRNSPTLSEGKKRRFEANVETVTIESGPSISTVNDWLRRMEPSTSQANDTRFSFRDMIQNVMEKLDTTLVETNRNTSKKLVNLFVEAQKKLSDQQEAHREMYKTVATQIITEIVSIMDEKFTNLDRRSQQIETEFKEHLKKQAFDLIREDCKQKRAMVLLLKEDVQAVFDHIKRSGTSP